MSHINEKWIENDMISGQWYEIETIDEAYYWMRLIEHGYGFPVFSLSLNDKYTMIRKILL